jgi:hypothetical protein
MGDRVADQNHDGHVNGACHESELSKEEHGKRSSKQRPSSSFFKSPVILSEDASVLKTVLIRVNPWQRT